MAKTPSIKSLMASIEKLEKRLESKNAKSTVTATTEKPHVFGEIVETLVFDVQHPDGNSDGFQRGSVGISVDSNGLRMIFVRGYNSKLKASSNAYTVLGNEEQFQAWLKNCGKVPHTAKK